MKKRIFIGDKINMVLQVFALILLAILSALFLEYSIRVRDIPMFLFITLYLLILFIMIKSIYQIRKLDNMNLLLSNLIHKKKIEIINVAKVEKIRPFFNLYRLVTYDGKKFYFSSCYTRTFVFSYGLDHEDLSSKFMKQIVDAVPSEKSKSLP